MLVNLKINQLKLAFVCCFSRNIPILIFRKDTAATKNCSELLFSIINIIKIHQFREDLSSSSCTTPHTSSESLNLSIPSFASTLLKYHF